MPTRFRAATLQFARRTLGLVVVLVGVVLLVPFTLLIAIGETRSGRLFGVLSLVVLLLIACLAAMIRPQSRTLARGSAAVVLLLVAAGLSVTLIRRMPSPTESPPAAIGLQARIVGGPRLPRYSPTRLLPEIDQVKLGVTLATRLGPMARDRGRALREVAMRLSREAAADPDASRLDSVTDLAVLELLGAKFDLGHSYRYVPDHAPGERLGAVVFLHGNGGNFRIMPRAWRPFAESRRFAIVCPTFGFGFWGEGGVEAVDRALVDALETLPIDPDRVYLAGVSDGGVGVTRSGAAHPSRYRGLIYVSPTMRLDELSRPEFVQGWRGRPILVFQGGRDWNVPKATVDPAVELLRRQGADVTYRVFPEEDHSLFFVRSPDVFGEISRWIAADR